MIIAIPYQNGLVFQHFGHTEQFKLYTAENGVITDEKIVDTNGSGHGALAAFLLQNCADALICGGIGMGARNALNEARITVYGGVSGSADEAAKALAAGTLVFDPNAKCDHHGEHHHHHEGASCGSHGCGGHDSGTCHC